MPAQISMQRIIDSALNGIVKAQKDYEQWTGGDWLWTAPEYFLTSSVASEISKIKGTKYLTLENSTYQALEDAGAIGKGRLHSDLRANGEEYYKSEEWKKVRIFALHRAKHRCQRCGASGVLQVHHLTYDNLYNEKPEDLEVLCKKCHKKADSEREY